MWLSLNRHRHSSLHFGLALIRSMRKRVTVKSSRRMAAPALFPLTPVIKQATKISPLPTPLDLTGLKVKWCDFLYLFSPAGNFLPALTGYHSARRETGTPVRSLKRYQAMPATLRIFYGITYVQELFRDLLRIPPPFCPLMSLSDDLWGH